MAQIIPLPEIWEQITNEKPQLPDEKKREITTKISFAVLFERNDPEGLHDRLVAFALAAGKLEKVGLPLTIGNLQEHAFTTVLEAYHWLFLKHLELFKVPMDIGEVSVDAGLLRTFANRMQLDWQRFREMGIHSGLCRGPLPSTC